MKTQAFVDELNSKGRYPKSKNWAIDETGVKNNGYPYLNEAYRVFLPEVAGAITYTMEGFDPMFAYKGDQYKFTFVPIDPTLWTKDMVVKSRDVVLTCDNFGVYTIDCTNISDYQIVTATGNFTPKVLTYSLTWNADGGSVSTTAVNPLEYGSNVSFSIVPKAGYVAKVTVNGAPVSYSGNTLEVLDVSGDLDVVVVFALRSFDIMVMSSPGGRIEEVGTNPVPFGGSITYNFIPDAGCKVAEVKVNGESVGDPSTYPFNNVAADHTIDITFMKQTGEIFNCNVK